ncbi:MAG: flagellar protein FliS [Lachnospiraceae bacterium]|nr:flagellar protein FliS [Lachnospiraceae bacterium]
MDRDKLQEFTRRVTQASRTELIVIMYDVILEDTAAARRALERDDTAEYERELKHAGRFVNELMGALDYRYGISRELLSLYSYLNKTLIRARMCREIVLLETADAMVQKLRDAFAQVSEQDTSGPMMRNTEQVYVGLTYGRGSLNESYLDPSGAKRGFMA